MSYTQANEKVSWKSRDLMALSTGYYVIKRTSYRNVAKEKHGEMYLIG